MGEGLQRARDAARATRTGPTPQGISVLLRKAGFARSNYGDKGIPWNGHGTGYRAFGGPPVTVYHYDEGQSCCGDCRQGHLDVAADMLSRYAEAISAAGWDVDLRLVSDEPHLRITAREDQS